MIIAATRASTLDCLKDLLESKDKTPLLVSKLSEIYSEFGVDAIAAAAKDLDKSHRDRLRRLVNARNKLLDEEAIGQFSIGDVVRVNRDCSYKGLYGVDLVIVELRTPYICCTRPSGTWAPGLMLDDLEPPSNNDR